MKPILIHRVLPAFERIGQALAAVAMVMIICLIAVMIYEVVARRVFNAPTIWAIDITYMTNGTLFLIGGAYTLQKNAHVRIDFLSSRLPVRVQHTRHGLCGRIARNHDPPPPSWWSSTLRWRTSPSASCSPVFCSPA